MFDQYYWNGQVIEDIEAWAEERGEKMLNLKRTRKVVSPHCKGMQEEVEYLKMPESFWKTLRIDDGWSYKVVDTEFNNNNNNVKGIT